MLSLLRLDCRYLCFIGFSGSLLHYFMGESSTEEAVMSVDSLFTRGQWFMSYVV